MKRIIFLTVGTKGDLYPFLGLANEMRRRGFKTTMLSSEIHRADCEAEGCEFEGIQSTSDYLSMLSHPDIMKPLKGLSVYLSQGIAATTEPAFRILESFAKREPCAVVFNNLMFAGLLAHEKLGLPAVSVFLHPFSHMSLMDPPKDSPFNTAFMNLIGLRARGWTVALFHKLYNANLKPVQNLRQSLGLKPVANMMGEWRHSAPMMIDLWPEWYCPAKSDWVGASIRTGFVDYDGPARPQANHPPEIENFLKRQPIIFTCGSGMLHGLEHSVRLFANACRELGLPGLMIAPSPSVDGFQTDENFRVIGPTPFGQIFDHASAIVSHGGIGTVARAIKAAKPQLITPMVNDQFDNGYHVERLGLGVSLPHSRISLKRLTEGLGRLQAPAMKSACEKAALDIHRHPGVTQTCDLLSKRFS